MSFTPLRGAIGALFIQLSSTNFYLQNGETIGFSSAISNIALCRATSNNLALIIGTLSSTWFIWSYYPQFISSYPQSNLLGSSAPLGLKFDQDYKLFSLAGFLVGIGTKLGNGCTSGHMIGGLSRLRLRSLIATSIFAFISILTVYLLDLKFKGFPIGEPSYRVSSFDTVPGGIIKIYLLSVLLIYAINPLVSQRVKKGSTSLIKALKIYNSLFSGFLFGLGLHVSGMINVSKTIGFLSILSPNEFDPTLFMIVLCTIIPNIFIWRMIKHPLLSEKFNVATTTKIDKRFIVGNVLFGLGWGILGICPGPGLINSVYHYRVLVWLGSFVLGSWTGLKV